MSQRWNAQSWPIGVKLLPESDLGLPNGVQGEIDYPTGLPLVGAANIVQTPVGARLIQGNPGGSVFSRPSSIATILKSVTLTASTNVPLPDMTWVMNAALALKVEAVSGTTPTLTMTLQFSPDGGTTWVSLFGGSASVNAVGNVILVLAGAGINSASPPGVTSLIQYSGPIPPLVRLSIVVGGTTPSYTVSIYGVTD